MERNENRYQSWGMGAGEQSTCKLERNLGQGLLCAKLQTYGRVDSRDDMRETLGETLSRMIHGD